jgi:hypothetical protein
MSDSALLGDYTLYTGAGLCAVWQPEHFAHVRDLTTYEDEVTEDPALERCIRAGVFVPLNVGGDGVFQTLLRTDGRTARERRHTLVSSEPYLLISKGVIAVGGLEQVGEYVGGAERVPLAAGRYTVTVHLIDWEADPESVDATGRPVEGALPDFVVEIHPEPSPAPRYRTNVMTFDPPE